MINRSKFPSRLGQVGLQDPGEERVLVKVDRGSGALRNGQKTDSRPWRQQSSIPEVRREEGLLGRSLHTHRARLFRQIWTKTVSTP